MPVTIDVNVEEMLKAQRAAEEMVAMIYGDPMLEAIRDCVLRVERDAKINAPVNTGTLRARLTPEVAVDGVNVMGIVGSNLTYAPYVEFGTRPHWPPLNPLIRWVELKFKATGSEAVGIAKAVQRKIARKGTKGQEFLRRAMENNMSYIENRMGDVMMKIVADTAEKDSA